MLEVKLLESMCCQFWLNLKKIGYYLFKYFIFFSVPILPLCPLEDFNYLVWGTWSGLIALFKKKLSVFHIFSIIISLLIFSSVISNLSFLINVLFILHIVCFTSRSSVSAFFFFPNSFHISPFNLLLMWGFLYGLLHGSLWVAGLNTWQ